MAPSMFHFFPILPPELRLAIWELAIRPTNEKHGLHHFTIIGQEDHNQEDFGLQHPHSGWRPQHTAIVPTNNNKSVYLWDAGLWTACVDSRDVMMNHFRIRQWEISRRQRELMPAINLLKDKLSRGEHFDYSAKTTARRGHEGWELIVQPVMDMFCFKSKDWQFARSWQQWADFFVDMPFTTFLSGHVPIRNMALEFDPSWNLDFPQNMSDLMEESSARGFIADAMFTLAHDHRAYNESMYLEVWIIDHGAVWSSEKGRDCTPVYYDCEQDFVEVKPGQVEFSGYENTAAYFLDLLSGLGDDAFAESSADQSWIRSGGWTKGHIRMLACAGKQRDKCNVW
ncbi:2EXR domain-containing protein [Fusarium sp. LHS14.1]|nr:2EXR domain-containing protein [Fusarium sp. LHS14.1]